MGVLVRSVAADGSAARTGAATALLVSGVDGVHVLGRSEGRGVWHLSVEALSEFAQAGQAGASVQRFDVVDELGDAG
jgi:hypothetical protein